MTKHDRTGAREGPEGSDEAKPARASSAVAEND